MTETPARNANPRNLFLGISLVIVCTVASIRLGMAVSTLALALTGAGFGWIYSFLNFCDPYSHSDFVQNGNAAVAFIAVYAIGAGAGLGGLFVWAASLAAIIAAETANSFITGSNRREFPVMGALLSVMAAIAAGMIYLQRAGAARADITTWLTGWALHETGTFFPAAMVALLAAAAVFVYRARDTLVLYSHGREYYRPPYAEYAGVKAVLIAGKALALSISYALVGVFGGVAYYLMASSRSRYAFAESTAAAVLFALILSSVSRNLCPAGAVAVSLVATQALFAFHRRNCGRIYR